jgi:hypothetical protein
MDISRDLYNTAVLGNFFCVGLVVPDFLYGIFNRNIHERAFIPGA